MLRIWLRGPTSVKILLKSELFFNFSLMNFFKKACFSGIVVSGVYIVRKNLNPYILDLYQDSRQSILQASVDQFILFERANIWFDSDLVAFNKKIYSFRPIQIKIDGSFLYGSFL